MAKIFCLAGCLVALANCIACGQELIVSVDNAQLTLIHNVSVSTRDAGLVEKLRVHEGDTVALGDVVAELDQAMYRAELAAASAETQIAAQESDNDVDIRYARKSADVNRKILTRSKKAASAYDGSISQTEIERLELELERSVLSEDQARHQQLIHQLTLKLKEEQMKLAELRLQFRQIKAPITGVIAEVMASEGEWLTAGQPVARIIGLNRLRSEALISQEYAFHLNSGQTAQFKTEVDGQIVEATGRIVFVSPEINPLTEEFLVWVEIDNRDGRLRPGFKGQLMLFGQRQSNRHDELTSEN